MKLKELFEKEVIENNISITSANVEHGCFYNNQDYRGKDLHGTFSCYGTHNLTSLKGSPDKIIGSYSCGSCDMIKTLEGSSKIVTGNFFCYSCINLTSLEGAPDSVGGSVNSSDCSIASLEGIGVSYLKQITGKLNLGKNPLTSHVLGLLKVKDLEEVYIDNFKVEIIINKYLKSGRRLSKCREELIDKGLKEYAKL